MNDDWNYLQQYNRHVDTVYRICYTYLKNKCDTEDVVQDTFVKLYQSGKQFASADHEKAWLIVTASNLCKNKLRANAVRLRFLLQNKPSPQIDCLGDETLDLLLSLPKNMKLCLYLYYYEGYTCPEIAEMLGKSQDSVRGYLHKGRKKLKEQLEGEPHESYQTIL